MRSIYLAGKIGYKDWRHDVAPDLRRVDPKGRLFDWSNGAVTVLDAFSYTGPFFSSCDHGCTHDIGMHAIVEDYDFACNPPVHGEATTSNRMHTKLDCMYAMRKSEILFFWLDDDLTAYGTLIELGYAWSFANMELENHETKEVVIATPYRPVRTRNNDGTINVPPLDNLWFALMGAGRHIVADTPQAAIRKLADEEQVRIAKENQRNARTDSPIEYQFWQRHLDADHRELRGMVTQHEVLGGKYRLDFAIPDKKIAIELDGHATHSQKDVFDKDRKRQRELELHGWAFLRFSGREVHNDPADCVRQAAEWVGRKVAV